MPVTSTGWWWYFGSYSRRRNSYWLWIAWRPLICPQNIQLCSQWKTQWNVNWSAGWYTRCFRLCWLFLGRWASLHILFIWVSLLLLTFLNLKSFHLENKKIFFADCWVQFNYKNFELAYPSDNCALVDRIGSNYVVFPSLFISLIMAFTAFAQIIYRSKKNGNLHNKRQWLLFAQAPTQICCWAVATTIWISDMRNYSEGRMWKVICIMLPQIMSHCLERYDSLGPL